MYSAPLIRSYPSLAASAHIPVLRWSVQPVTELAQTAEVTVGADGFAASSE
jgi:hypothetical protein